MVKHLFCTKNKTMRKIILIFSFFLSLMHLHGVPNLNAPVLNARAWEWADSVLKKLSTDEKIGQLFMVQALSEWKGNDYLLCKNEVRQLQPGGILFMQGGPVRQMNMMNDLNGVSKVPLFFAIDGEWGLAMRLDSVLSFPKNMLLGSIRDSRVIYAVGEAVGAQCREMGIHINFAPVLDVNNNPLNPVINIRSFGEDPRRVSECGTAFFAGMQSRGVLAVGKHFPGHGDTGLDSHHDLPLIDKTMDALKNNELIPFKRAIDMGIQGIMTAHLEVPALDSSLLPVSLSKPGIDFLRDSLQFKGLIFSDALNMRAVDKRFEKHYLKAFLAGNDVLLFPANLKQGVDEIKAAIAAGIVTTDVLEKRVRKVLAWKYALGVNRKKVVGRVEANQPLFEAAIFRALKGGMVLVKNENNIPLSVNSDVNTKLILVGNAFSAFSEIVQKYRPAEIVQVANPAQYTSALSDDFTGQIVVAVAGNVYARTSNYGVTTSVQKLLRQLPPRAEISLVLFTNPYALSGLDGDVEKKLKSILVAYEADKHSQNVAAQIIMGGAPALGVLPVTAGNKFPSGTGLYTQKVRLGYSVPELEGLRTDSLKRIDQLIDLAIKIKAMPGCQVLIARNGEIVYDKSFGHHTYDKANPVKWSDVYDIASLTKVVSTTPVIMHLTDFQLISPEAKLGSFNGIVSSPFKKEITVNELLMHQSGLKPYIPFHFMMLDADALPDGLFSKRRSSVFSIYLGEKVYLNNQVRFKKGFVSQAPTKNYSIQGAQNFWLTAYMPDSLRIWIDSSLVDTRRSYRYSDLNFYYLQQVAEKVAGTSLDKLADSLLYKPLGMYRTGYLPLNRFAKSEIVPTENDRYFRRQLVQGYVHDQTAALQGGVGGNAGVFSNTTDLAKYCQMLLDKGFYGETRFFEPQTVDYYTQTGNQLNRRGLGFDKPEPDTKKTSPACKSASLKSFGHTGFTGTYLWVDPQSNLIYIFLSNRVHPDVYNTKLSDKNIRTNIHQMVYNAFIP